jgi:hypothetical protein
MLAVAKAQYQRQRAVHARRVEEEQFEQEKIPSKTPSQGPSQS